MALVLRGVGVGGGAQQLDSIEGGDRRGEDDRLTHLEPVDSGEDVDGVGGEEGEGEEEDVKEEGELEVGAEQRLELQRHRHPRQPARGAVHQQQRQVGKQRERDLVSPPQVEHVVGKAEEGGEHDGEERGEKLGEPLVGERRAAALGRLEARARKWDEDGERQHVDGRSDHALRLRDGHAADWPDEVARLVALRRRLVEVDPAYSRAEEHFARLLRLDQPRACKRGDGRQRDAGPEQQLLRRRQCSRGGSDERQQSDSARAGGGDQRVA